MCANLVSYWLVMHLLTFVIIKSHIVTVAYVAIYQGVYMQNSCSNCYEYRELERSMIQIGMLSMHATEYCKYSGESILLRNLHILCVKN